MLRVAVVGLGWWGKILTTIIQLECPSLEVALVIDANREAAASFGLSKKIPHVATLEEALADRYIDAVVLATPHGLHEAQVHAAARAGKHVFCEKPLGLTEQSARKSIAVCHDAGVVLGLGHERRFEPPVVDLKHWLGDGLLGRPLQIEANFSHDRFLSLPATNWRLSPDQAPAAGMTGPGIHLVDLAVMLAGPVKRVVAHSATLASELPSGDVLSALLCHQSGSTSYISATLATPFISRFAFFGSKGWVEIRDKAHVENPQGWQVQRQLAGQALEHLEYPPAPSVRDNLEAFASAIAGKATYPITPEQMIHAAAAMDATFQSAAARGGIVEIQP